MVVEREIIEEIRLFLPRREYIAIIGPRQSGKTTLLSLLKDCLLKDLGVREELIHIVTFEDRRLLSQFERDPISFVRSYLSETAETTYLMLDEFQYAEGGGQKLKLIYDTLPNLKVIITGSSSLEIRAEVGRYMVGRLLTFFLFPFGFGEFLRTKDTRLSRIYCENPTLTDKSHNSLENNNLTFSKGNVAMKSYFCNPKGNNKLGKRKSKVSNFGEKSRQLKSWLIEKKNLSIKSGRDIFSEEILRLYEEYCIWGGYPAVVLSKTEKEKGQVLNEIHNAYLLKDIKGLLNLVTDKNLLLLSQYLAGQIGNIVVYRNLSEASGLEYRGLKRHLNILKDTFVVDEIRPFFTNRNKELSKNPMVFFVDTGLRNSLMENMNGFVLRPDTGAIVENAVFVRLKETFQTEKFNFYRTKAGAEVDFVLHIRGELTPIEVKFSRFDKERIERGFASFIRQFLPKSALILTKDYWGRLKDKTEIMFWPVYYL